MLRLSGTLARRCCITFHRQPSRVSKPRVHFALSIVFLEYRSDFVHVTVGRDPSSVDVWEVMLAVVALLGALEPDRAPERLDIAQHF